MDNGGEFYAYTDWVYRSEVNFFLYDSIEFTGKSLVEGGLRLGYTWGYGKYDVAVFGRNITDEVQVVGAHRLQQPDRHHQRAAPVRCGVQGQLLTVCSS